MKGLWQECFKSVGTHLSGASQSIEVQSSAQVLKAINAYDAIGLIGFGCIDEWRSAPACDHVFSGEQFSAASLRSLI